MNGMFLPGPEANGGNQVQGFPIKTKNGWSELDPDEYTYLLLVDKDAHVVSATPANVSRMQQAEFLRDMADNLEAVAKQYGEVE